MTSYRSTHTCDAVQWAPGSAIPGVELATDDLAYAMGWPSGSAYLVRGPEVNRVRPGDWVLTYPTGGRVVMSDERFRSDWAAVAP
jgi:hypothetical protein